MDINTSQLPYLLAIAAHGNLLSAAQELGVVQPTLSKYLAKLEQEAGAPLFVRKSKRLYPTAVGQAYLEAAQDIVNIIERTHAEIAHIEHPKDELKIGVSPFRGASLVADIYPDLCRQLPHMELICKEGYTAALREYLLDGEINIALTSYAPKLHAGLTALTFHREELVLAAPAYYSPEQKEKQLDKLPYVNLRDYAHAVFVMPGKDSALAEATEQVFQKANFQPVVGYTSPNVKMQEALIRSGAGIGLLPANQVKDDENITYWRIRPYGSMDSCFLMRSGHVLTRAERCFIFLTLRNDILHKKLDIQWNDIFRKAIREFDPAFALSLNLEEAT